MPNYSRVTNLAATGGVYAGAIDSEVPVYVPGSMVVDCTAGTLSITPQLHANKYVTLNKADGIAVTLPAATGTGYKYTFIVGTTFTSNGTIKVANATDVMVGTALLLQDTVDTIVGFETAASSDTITFYTATSNTTGGVAGAIVELVDIASGKWFVRYVSAAGGTEATPFSATVS